ncbi:acyl carrier protein [Streptomyces sp. NPDC003719]
MNQPFIDLLTPFLPNLGDRPLTEDSRLHDLGMNSMKAIDLLFAIEDGLGVSLPDEDLNDTTFATAGSLWAAVRRAGAAEGEDTAAA